MLRDYSTKHTTATHTGHSKSRAAKLLTQDIRKVFRTFPGIVVSLTGAELLGNEWSHEHIDQSG